MALIYIFHQKPVTSVFLNHDNSPQCLNVIETACLSYNCARKHQPALAELNNLANILQKQIRDDQEGDSGAVYDCTDSEMFTNYIDTFLSIQF